MSFQTLLNARRNLILRFWFDAIIEMVGGSDRQLSPSARARLKTSLKPDQSRLIDISTEIITQKCLQIRFRFKDLHIKNRLWIWLESTLSSHPSSCSSWHSPVWPDPTWTRVSFFMWKYLPAFRHLCLSCFFLKRECWINICPLFKCFDRPPCLYLVRYWPV